MSIATLLVMPASPAGQSAFAFEHAMAHRSNYQTMGPLDRWSVLPYLLDPPYDTTIPGSAWHRNHQQAHDDFVRSVPAGYERPQVGIPTNQYLLDSNLGDPRSLTWWTFINHQEHYEANTTMLPVPNPTTETGAPSSYPWWIGAARWTPPPFW